jgi:putative ATP-binding cassette transporter
MALHLARARQIRESFAEANLVETQVMDGFTDLIEGFKEVKLNTDRSDELAETVRNLSGAVMQSRLNARTLFATDFVISQVMFFLLTGMMVFVVPMIADIDSETLIKITTTSLFLIGPLSNAISGIPVLQRVNSAAEAILLLESRLSEIGRGEVDGVRSFPTFQRLALRSATYRYPGKEGESGFNIGPIDLEIRRGRCRVHHGRQWIGQVNIAEAAHRALSADRRYPCSGKYPDRCPEHFGLSQFVWCDLFRQSFIPKIVRNSACRSRTGGHAVPAAGAGRQDAHRRPCVRADHSFGRTAQKTCFDCIAAGGSRRSTCSTNGRLIRIRTPREVLSVILPQLQAAGRTVIAVTHDERYFDVPELRVRRVHMGKGERSGSIRRNSRSRRFLPVLARDELGVVEYA